MSKAKPRTGDRHVGTAKTIRFTDEQAARLDALKDRTGGTYADAIDAAARALLGSNDRRADLALELRRLADQIEGGKPQHDGTRRREKP
jgi:predicted DNA-binding protein